NAVSIQARTGHDLPKRLQHSIQITLCLARAQRNFRLAHDSAQTLLNHLKADASATQGVVDNIISDLLFARVERFKLINENIGINEELSAHSFLPDSTFDPRVRAPATP